MSRDIFKYVFKQSIDTEEVQLTLTLARIATSSLHGESRVRLEARHALDNGSRTCVIDAGGDVGRDLNRLFVGFIRREFGEDGFNVALFDLNSADCVNGFLYEAKSIEIDFRETANPYYVTQKTVGSSE